MDTTDPSGIVERACKSEYSISSIITIHLHPNSYEMVYIDELPLDDVEKKETEA